MKSKNKAKQNESVSSGNSSLQMSVDFKSPSAKVESSKLAANKAKSIGFQKRAQAA